MVQDLSTIREVLREALASYQDFPSPGVLFEDILPIFLDPNKFQMLLDGFKQHFAENNTRPDVIVGLDARGFLFGPALALQLGCAFVPVRKKGKLPGEVFEAHFSKEYGEDVFAIQKGAIKRGQNVVIVDDIIATGGSAAAAGSLVELAGGNLLEYSFILELKFLNGREKLDAPVFTLLTGQCESSSKV